MAPFIQGNEKGRLEGDESSELEGYSGIVINVKFVLFAEWLFVNVTFIFPSGFIAWISSS